MSPSSIGMVIRDIPKGLLRDIIVCNNNSTDNTSMDAGKAGAIVVDQPHRGYGHACLAVMAYILIRSDAQPPDIVVFMDGDYSYHPQEMASLSKPILAGKDLVISSRVTGNADPGSLTRP